MENGGPGGCANGRGGRGVGGDAGGGFIFGGNGGQGGNGRDDALNKDGNIDISIANRQVEPESDSDEEPIQRCTRCGNRPIQEEGNRSQNAGR
ncbi:hypothetical protein DPMN_057657 [Dreissena polymorpha]|uniref:Uncharacterized protein n=1 Tax=Dreissena polymorpha TaxID=45954 RepID=A0A9D4C0I8_DREPO|nr:hypothetical protein DPMN_057657 [Dreissena polymorpha]